MGNRILEINDLSIQVGDKLLINRLNFSLMQGEKAVISGVSGSGKSTLLRSLMGFVPGFTGQIKIQGIELNRKTVSEIRQNVAWMPQELIFNGQLSKELIYFPFQFAANRFQKPDESEVYQLLSCFFLSPDILELPVSSLSGGQKQRILLASCLLLKRRLVFLDEPFSALDTETAESIAEYLFSLTNVTILAASHSPEFINRCTQQINL